MTRIAVKVCCMANTGETEMAAEAGADYIGLVGPMPSGPGVLTLEAAAEIAANVGSGPKPVLLSSARSAEELVAEVQAVGACTVQIVRHVPPEAHRCLAQTAPDLTRWQVIHVEGSSALEQIAIYHDLVDAFLLDSGRPTMGELGGTGRAHDWQISRAIVAATERPVFLAGGLTPENVGDAIARVRPHGVDVCSGVRTGDRLDSGLLSEFMAAVAEAGASLEAAQS
ncbi:MAG: phosphoribosylanthranilate isomerase [Pseudomonadota bacterium]